MHLFGEMVPEELLEQIERPQGKDKAIKLMAGERFEKLKRSERSGERFDELEAASLYEFEAAKVGKFRNDEIQKLGADALSCRITLELGVSGAPAFSGKDTDICDVDDYKRTSPDSSEILDPVAIDTSVNKEMPFWMQEKFGKAVLCFTHQDYVYDTNIDHVQPFADFLKQRIARILEIVNSQNEKFQKEFLQDAAMQSFFKQDGDGKVCATRGFLKTCDLFEKNLFVSCSKCNGKKSASPPLVWFRSNPFFGERFYQEVKSKLDLGVIFDYVVKEDGARQTIAEYAIEWWNREYRDVADVLGSSREELANKFVYGLREVSLLRAAGEIVKANKSFSDIKKQLLISTVVLKSSDFSKKNVDVIKIFFDGDAEATKRAVKNFQRVLKERVSDPELLGKLNQILEDSTLGKYSFSSTSELGQFLLQPPMSADVVLIDELGFPVDASGNKLNGYVCPERPLGDDRELVFILRRKDDGVFQLLSPGKLREAAVKYLQDIGAAPQSPSGSSPSDGSQDSPRSEDARAAEIFDSMVNANFKMHYLKKVAALCKPYFQDHRKLWEPLNKMRVDGKVKYQDWRCIRNELKKFIESSKQTGHQLTKEEVLEKLGELFESRNPEKRLRALEEELTQLKEELHQEKRRRIDAEQERDQERQGRLVAEKRADELVHELALLREQMAKQQANSSIGAAPPRSTLFSSAGSAETESPESRKRGRPSSSSSASNSSESLPSGVSSSPDSSPRDDESKQSGASSTPVGPS